MKNPLSVLASLSNEQLLARAHADAGNERHSTADLIASLGEIDARGLYVREGYSSMFAFCRRALLLSEEASYTRIEVARTARQWPIILEMLADGRLNLTTVRLLAPHLTDENHQVVLAAAEHCTKREVERQVAALRPLPPVPSSVRKLPAPKANHREATSSAQAVRADLLSAPDCATPSPASESPSATIAPPSPARARPAVIAPLAPERYKVQMTVSRETHDRLRRVQDLMRHQVPNGDPAAIFDRALTLLLRDLERRQLGATTRPRRTTRPSNPRSRHVPAAVRRQVWARDDGQCTFVGTDGRCTEHGFLQIHHVDAYADGGLTTLENLTLRCRAHNVYESEQRFGAFVLRERPAAYATRSGTS